VELDTWDGKTLISVVGFLFQRTRVMGAPIPFHINFEEINLRFYVRRKVGAEWRRGVVFVKEIVPRPWIALAARLFYHENYEAHATGHFIEPEHKRKQQEGSKTWLIEYTWRSRSRWSLRGKLHRMGALAAVTHPDPQPIQDGSEEQFITQHFWGYTRLDDAHTSEYRVEHPEWRIWAVAQPYLLSDVRALYGPQFHDPLRRRPRSAFLAEGSPIKVFFGEKITG